METIAEYTEWICIAGGLLSIVPVIWALRSGQATHGVREFGGLSSDVQINRDEHPILFCALLYLRLAFGLGLIGYGIHFLLT